MKDPQFECILFRAMQPEIREGETALRCRKIRKGHHMNMKRVMKKGCIAAAVIALLTTTAYASGALNIKTLVSGGVSKTYETVQQAEDRAGFRMDDLTHFSNGYAFDSARVVETRALDEKDQVRLSYNEIEVELKNPAGERIHLNAYANQDGIEASSVPADQVRQLGEITLEYRLHHYKFVPADYQQTEADKLWLQQPGNFMSYGSEDGIEESNVAFLNWEKEGICYMLMDSDGSEPAETLFTMAKELILSGQ